MNETQQTMNNQLDSSYDNAELVIYTTEANECNFPPQTQWGQDLNVVSFSLWARFPETGKEIPIYSRSEHGIWFSLDADTYHPNEATPVSEPFIKAVTNMVDEEIGDGWGDPTEEVFNDMTPVEQYIFTDLNNASISFKCEQIPLIIDWCQKQMEAN